MISPLTACAQVSLLMNLLIRHRLLGWKLAVLHMAETWSDICMLVLKTTPRLLTLEVAENLLSSSSWRFKPDRRPWCCWWATMKNSVFPSLSFNLLAVIHRLIFPYASSDLEEANLRVARCLRVEGCVYLRIICIKVVGQPIVLDGITNRKHVVSKHPRIHHRALGHAKYHLCGSRRLSSNAHSVLPIRQKDLTHSRPVSVMFRRLDRGWISRSWSSVTNAAERSNMTRNTALQSQMEWRISPWTFISAVSVLCGIL